MDEFSLNCLGDVPVKILRRQWVGTASFGKKSGLEVEIREHQNIGGLQRGVTEWGQQEGHAKREEKDAQDRQL